MWYRHYGIWIVLFHNYLSSLGVQPKQRLLAYKLEQPTADCKAAIFHKWWCYTKHGAIMMNLTLWDYWGILLSKYHNAGIWSTGYNTLSFMLKTYSTSGILFEFPLYIQRYIRRYIQTNFFVNEKFRIFIKSNSLKFVPRGPMSNTPASV